MLGWPDTSIWIFGVSVRFFSLVTLSATMLSGCFMVGPDYKEPKLAVAKDWQYASKRTNASIRESQNKTANWWKIFNDQTLNALIEKGYQNNLSLQGTGVKVLYSRAALAMSVGELYPQTQAITSNYTYNRTGGSSLDSILPNKFYTATAGLSANWEIDFWGKYRRAIQANDANFLASMAGYDQALTSLISEIASTYVNIRTYQGLISVTKRNIRSQEESTRITEERFRLGQTSKLDVELAKTQLGQTQATLPSQMASLEEQKNNLAVLLSIVPNEVSPLLKQSKGIPRAPSQIEIGIPKEVLAQRPDVAEARLSAIAQLATEGATVAELYPAFSLNGVFSFASNSIGENSVSNLFVWSGRQVTAGPSILFPILNYGQITNQVRMQDALTQQALLNYQSIVLQAQQEVANAIANYRYSKETVRILSQTVVDAKSATHLAVVRYRNGETDYTSVLDAQRNQLSVESDLVKTLGDIDLALCSLYRALGGGWQLRGDKDVISAQIKEEMAARTNWGGLLKPENHLPQALAKESSLEKTLPTW